MDRSVVRPLRAAAAVLLLATIVVLVPVAWWITDGDEHPGALLVVAVEGLVSGTVGLLVARRLPANPIGWLLLAHGLLAVLLLGFTESVDTTWQAAAAQLGEGAWPLLYVCVALIGYLFPDGRLPSDRWRRWVWTYLAGNAMFLVGATSTAEEFREEYPAVGPPLPGLPEGLAEAMSLVGIVLVAVGLVGAVAAPVSRLRSAEGQTRLQLLWFVWAVATVPLALIACLLTGETGEAALLVVALLGAVLPAAIGVALLRHGLFDIEVVLSRTVTYGALSLAVIGVYAGVVAVAGRWLDDRLSVGLLATGLVAVAIQPVHAGLRRRVERLVYGDRSDPVGALRRLSDQVEATVDAEEVVRTVTTSIADALRLARVRVELPGEPRVESNAATLRVPLRHRGVALGSLVVEVPPGRHLSAADRALLDDLARHASAVISAVHLTLELQRSRERLVVAQEEERRRLRRDLHDGLGPTLAGLVLKVGAAQARSDAAERNHLLDEVRMEIRDAIADVRRLVDDLRPPALDELGLVEAVRQRADALRGGTGCPEITVVAPAALGALPAAVEVAAYRIATEAMTNVVRHSGARHCEVRIVRHGGFELSVSDDGNGQGAASVAGVGWTSMRERAVELGGSCTVLSRPGAGTTVRAVLPLPDATPRDAVVEAGQ